MTYILVAIMMVTIYHKKIVQQWFTYEKKRKRKKKRIFALKISIFFKLNNALAPHPLLKMDKNITFGFIFKQEY